MRRQSGKEPCHAGGRGLESRRSRSCLSRIRRTSRWRHVQRRQNDRKRTNARVADRASFRAMRRGLLFAGVLVVVAVLLAVLLVARHDEPDGRAGFAGDRAANLGYAVWLSPDHRTLFLERRPYARSANGGSGPTLEPLRAWRISFRHSSKQPYVAAPAFRGDRPSDLPLPWSEVIVALRAGRSTPKPEWVKRHVG